MDSVFCNSHSVNSSLNMDSTRQQGKSGDKTPVENRPEADPQEMGNSDAEEVDSSGPGTDVEPQASGTDTPAMTQGTSRPSPL